MSIDGAPVAPCHLRNDTLVLLTFKGVEALPLVAELFGTEKEAVDGSVAACSQNDAGEPDVSPPSVMPQFAGDRCELPDPIHVSEHVLVRPSWRQASVDEESMHHRPSF